MSDITTWGQVVFLANLDAWYEQAMQEMAAEKEAE